MLRVGLIGWRGMVGSVLLQRMREENDFAGLGAVFFSTSNAGGPAPAEAGGALLADAADLRALSRCDVLISCQGGAYTSEIYKPLRQSGWKGYWIDAASTLRMSDDAIIILDPVNAAHIAEGLAHGIRTFASGNCTVSLMLMATHPLFQAGLVEWTTSMTYQAASGAGAAQMLELVEQMDYLANTLEASAPENALDEVSPSDNEAQVSASDRRRRRRRRHHHHHHRNALDVDRMLIETQRSPDLPTQEFGAPLAGSLLPWIDSPMAGGQTREEWKGMAEGNKILGIEPPVPIDGICVRVGSMRCHSQGLCIKLKKDVPLGEIEQMLAGGNEWVRVIPNDKDSTLRCLTPTAVSGTLNVPIGRLHKLNLGPEFLGAFTVGDQLLWGAAEPLRRMLRILREKG